MATDFNYVVNVDTTRVMGAMAEVRSQVGMALGGAAGGPGGGFNDASGGIASGFAQMAAGFARGPGFMGGVAGMVSGSTFGGTFTNPAIAYNPHYGAIQAETSLQQEWLIHRYGLPAAQLLKPPGVGAGEYALGVEKNYIDRQLEATHGAASAARTAFMSGVGGLVAGEGAQIVGGAVGAFAGARIATSMFGAGAAGAGRMLGGLAGGMGAFMLAQDFVSDVVENRFAQVERVGGITRELGEIAGADRGLNRVQRYNLGVSARQAATDVGLDSQEMGDILALGRQHGMLPTATDPAKAREQFKDFARAVEEGAQVLHTSLGNAAAMIKGMTNLGFGAERGMMNLVGMAGAAGVSPSAMYGIGMAGAGFARQNLLSGAQGFSLFTGAVGSHGLNREELSMAGGATGVGQMIASTQIGAALSPMGDMQLMAAQGGRPLGDLFSMPGAAIGAMAQGGDIIANMVHFETHKREMLRGVGASGIRTMARHQLESMAGVLESVSPGVKHSDAMRFMAQQMGLNEVQAKAYAGDGSGGGGGGGGMGKAYQLEAMQGVLMSRGAAAAGIIAPTATALQAKMGLAGEYGFGQAISGAVSGGMIGSFIPGVGSTVGAVIGGVGGLVHQNWGAIKSVFGGPPPWASIEEQADYHGREMAAEYEDKMGAVKRRLGVLDIDRGVAARALHADLSGVRLNFDATAGSPIASGQTAASFRAMGLTPVAAGAGTIFAGGNYWSASQVQKLYNQPMVAGPVTERDLAQTRSAAYGAVYSSDAAARFGKPGQLDDSIGILKGAYDAIQGGGTSDLHVMSLDMAGESMNREAHRLIGNIPDQKSRAELLSKLAKPGGLNDPSVRGFLSQATGISVEALPSSFMAGQALAVAGKGLIETSLTSEAQMLKSVYGGYGPAAGDAYRGTLASQQTEWDKLHPGVTPMDRIYASRPTAENFALQAHAKANAMTPKQLSTMSDEERSRITSGGSGALLDRYYSSLVGMDDYQRGMDAAARGDWRTANKLIHGAQERVMTESHGDLRGLHVDEMDVRKEFHRRGFAGQIGASVGALGAVMGVDMNNALKQVDNLIGSKVFARTDMMEEAKTANKTVNQLKPRKRRAGAMQHAVGFGQHEEAMTTINKSLKDTNSMLKRTAGMLETLDKKINPPAGGGNAAPTTPSTSVRTGR